MAPDPEVQELLAPLGSDRIDARCHTPSPSDARGSSQAPLFFFDLIPRKAPHSSFFLRLLSFGSLNGHRAVGTKE